MDEIKPAAQGAGSEQRPRQPARTRGIKDADIWGNAAQKWPRKTALPRQANELGSMLILRLLKALVWCSIPFGTQAGVGANDLLQDVASALGPNERLGLGVVMSDVLIDGIPQFRQVSTCTTGRI